MDTEPAPPPTEAEVEQAVEQGEQAQGEQAQGEEEVHDEEVSDEQEQEPVAPRNRIKLYELNDEGQWDDRGTGYVDISPVPLGENSRIVVRKEVEEGSGDPGEDGEAMLDCPILQPIEGIPPYQKQGETIICWSEPDGSADRALSFQDNEFAAEVWALLQGADLVCASFCNDKPLVSDETLETVVTEEDLFGEHELDLLGEYDLGEALLSPPTVRKHTGRLNSLAPQEDLFDDSPDSSATSAADRRDQGAASSFLPVPTIDNLDLILHTLSRVAMTGRERIAQEVGNVDWLGALLNTFERLEEEQKVAKAKCTEHPEDVDLKEELDESAARLSLLFQCVRCLFLLSNHHLTETLLSDEMYLYIFGILEHDPDILPDRRIPHRRYLKEKAHFNDVIKFNNDLVPRKIHINFRLTYLKDVAMPRALDDASFSQLCSMIMHNSMMMLENFLCDDSTVLDDLFALVAEKFPALMFLHQLLTLSKTMPPAGNERARLYEEIEKRNKFFNSLLPYLDKKQPEVSHPAHLQIHKERSVAMDVLLMSVGQQTSMIRRYILRESKTEPEKRNTDGLLQIEPPPGVIRGYGSPFFKLLLRLVCHETNISVQSQAAEAIRLILDGHTFEGTGVDKDELLNVFYEQGPVEILAEPLRVNLDPSADTPECAYYARQLICDLIGFCVENHSYRMKFFILRQNIAVKCAAQQKYVAVAALRCLKVICSTKDEFYHRALSQRDALKIPIKVFEENLPFSDSLRNMNLVASTFDELLDFIQRDDCKILVGYLCTVHEQTLRKLELRVPSCKQLLERGRHRDTLGAGSLAPGSSGGFSTGLQNVGGRGSRGRQRSPGRGSDDDVDDSYFDEDDDEEETTGNQGSSLGSLMLSYGDDEEDIPDKSSEEASGKFSTDEDSDPKSPPTGSRESTEEQSTDNGAAEPAPATPERPVSRGHYVGTPRPKEEGGGSGGGSRGGAEGSPSSRDSEKETNSAPANKRAKLSAVA